jgi:hypothetical protein
MPALLPSCRGPQMTTQSARLRTASTLMMCKLPHTELCSGWLYCILRQRLFCRMLMTSSMPHAPLLHRYNDLSAKNAATNEADRRPILGKARGGKVGYPRRLRTGRPLDQYNDETLPKGESNSTFKGWNTLKPATLYCAAVVMFCGLCHF